MFGSGREEKVCREEKVLGTHRPQTAEQPLIFSLIQSDCASVTDDSRLAIALIVHVNGR